MVMGGEVVQEVLGSNPGTGCLMDIILLYKGCNVCLKTPKIKDKRGRGWAIEKERNLQSNCSMPKFQKKV